MPELKSPGRPVLATGVLLLISVAASAEDAVYTAIRHETLFSALGINAERVPGSFSASYRVRPAETSGLQWIDIAVYATPALARDAMQRAVWLTQVGPSGTHPIPEVGDEFLGWPAPNGDRSNMRLRRANVVVGISCIGSWDEALGFARRIDALIRDDLQIAPRGTFAETPEIVSIGVPESVRKGSRIKISPGFRGLGDVAALRVAVVAAGRFSSLTETTADGRSRSQVVVRGSRPDGLDDAVRERQRDEDGRFILNIPDQVGPLKLTMIVATPDNVVVTKEFTVNVTE